MMKNLKRNWLVVSSFETQGISRILTRELESPKNLPLIDCFWPKYIMLKLKKYRGVMFDCTQDWCKVWRKTRCCFQKLTCRIWQIFTIVIESLQIWTLTGILLSKVENLWTKKNYRGVMFDGTEYWSKIWRKNDLCFQKWHEGFSKFSPESKNWDFDGVLLSKVENLWAENLQESFVSWQWKMMQDLKRNWHEEFDEFWPQHSKISKMCTLMGFFWTKYILFELKRV